jgi:hypothetical protein
MQTHLSRLTIAILIVQHAYVKQTTTKYIQDHPGTPATKALSAVTGIK